MTDYQKLSIQNESHLPTEEVESLVRFALSEIDGENTHVLVSPGSWGGEAGHFRAFSKSVRAQSRLKNKRYLIHIRVPETEAQLRLGVSRTYSKGRGTVNDPGRWPVQILYTWQEYVVGLAAHEGKHIEQFKEGLRRSEVACEYFENWMLKRYREEVVLPSPK